MPKTIDEQSKEKAYHLYDSGAIKGIEVGTIKGLCQIHKYIFDETLPHTRDFGHELGNKVHMLH